MGFAFPVVDRKHGAGDTVLLRTRVNSVTNMSAEVVAFACLDRVMFQFYISPREWSSSGDWDEFVFTIIERVAAFEHRKRQVKCKISDFPISKGKFIAHNTNLKPPMLDSHQNPFPHHHGHHEEDFLLQFSLPAKAEEDTVAARNTLTPKIHGRSGSPSRATTLRLQSLPFLVTKCSNMFSGIDRTVDMDNHVVIQMTCPERNATS
ncbi:hypothetical protein NC653_020608 [Populus alba x Populus x berolinensis]|uniref:Uncharacterized protein n=1 Tax=Populus alba x Populus x berolinensis TaxID=444605 RepID=A0AAD6MKT5_9ROSI|nr:hypothetical protein NC653_020608 [Populus alba x Populus x berolinensis]